MFQDNQQLTGYHFLMALALLIGATALCASLAGSVEGWIGNVLKWAVFGLGIFSLISLFERYLKSEQTLSTDDSRDRTYNDQNLESRDGPDPMDQITTLLIVQERHKRAMHLIQAGEIEEAIELLEKNLRVLPRERFPDIWATTHHNLASAFRNRIKGDPAQNIEEAIKHCNLAIEVRGKQPDLEYECAGTLNTLANCYLDRIAGIPADNIEAAIKAHKLALKYRPRSRYPEEWARSQHNLGNAYLKRLMDDPVENIEKAIECYDKALEVRTQEAYPEEWENTCNSLAVAHSKLSLFST